MEKKKIIFLNIGFILILFSIVLWTVFSNLVLCQILAIITLLVGGYFVAIPFSKKDPLRGHPRYIKISFLNALIVLSFFIIPLFFLTVWTVLRFLSFVLFPTNPSNFVFSIAFTVILIILGVYTWINFHKRIYKKIDKLMK